MKAETTSNTEVQYKGEGKMLGFHHAPQVFPCVDCMGWNTTNPDRRFTGKHWGDALRHQVAARQQDSAMTDVPAPTGREQEGHERDLVLTSAPASKAELT